MAVTRAPVVSVRYGALAVESACLRCDGVRPHGQRQCALMLFGVPAGSGLLTVSTTLPIWR